MSGFVFALLLIIHNRVNESTRLTIVVQVGCLEQGRDEFKGCGFGRWRGTVDTEVARKLDSCSINLLVM